MAPKLVCSRQQEGSRPHGVVAEVAEAAKPDRVCLSPGCLTPCHPGSVCSRHMMTARTSCRPLVNISTLVLPTKLSQFQIPLHPAWATERSDLEQGCRMNNKLKWDCPDLILCANTPITSLRKGHQSTSVSVQRHEAIGETNSSGKIHFAQEAKMIV
ncbi:uncharacterized protein [Melanerpes formicivorus]|uniref:uncharacterized protein isoform X5 n=1 Tax=Melanerpes formicivorus TaxID=211600 RepID=UPI00358EAAC8